jgi:hypothetical protein
MKTLLMYQEIGDNDDLQYAILDGDFSKFHGVEINGCTHPFEQEFQDFFWETEVDWEQKIPLSTDISLLEQKNWDKVAHVRFIL